MSATNIKSKALYFLSRREYAYQELFTKLKKYSDNEGEIRQVLDNLRESGYLSEQRFIQSFINSRSKKHGLLKIKYQLSQKTTDSDLVNQIINDTDFDEVTLARELFKKKFGIVATDRQELAKQIRFLQNRGFSYSIIKQVINGSFE
jgi:regulatory protein